jgi:hypothetical protein
MSEATCTPLFFYLPRPEFWRGSSGEKLRQCFTHLTHRVRDVVAEHLNTLFYMKQLYPMLHCVFSAIFFVSQRDLRNSAVRCTVVSG